MSTASCPSTGYHWAESGSVFFSLSYQVFIYTDNPLFSSLNSLLASLHASVLASTSCLLVFEFSQELLLYPCRPPFTFASLSACWDGTLFSLEVLEKSLKNYWKTILLGSSFLQDRIPKDSSRQVPKQAKIRSHEVQVCDSSAHLVSFSVLSSHILQSPQGHISFPIYLIFFIYV